jgi:hypothetical protein
MTDALAADAPALAIAAAIARGEMTLGLPDDQEPDDEQCEAADPGGCVGCGIKSLPHPRYSACPIKGGW